MLEQKSGSIESLQSCKCAKLQCRHWHSTKQFYVISLQVLSYLVNKNRRRGSQRFYLRAQSAWWRPNWSPVRGHVFWYCNWQKDAKWSIKICAKPVQLRIGYGLEENAEFFDDWYNQHYRLTVFLKEKLIFVRNDFDTKMELQHKLFALLTPFK